MSFSLQIPVRFGQVDAAGIVFYPRYFEMLNVAVEEWFEARTGKSFLTLHLDQRLGIPTVKIASEFMAPSRLGDILTISIDVERLGERSCAMRYGISCAGQERARASGVLVCMNLDTGKSVPWPAAIRDGLASTETIEVKSIA